MLAAYAARKPLVIDDSLPTAEAPTAQRHAELLAQDFELVHGSGSVNIGCNQEGLAFIRQEILCELTGRGRFTSTLQTDHHNGREGTPVYDRSRFVRAH